MVQLDLFADAPRDYHEALSRLARLDTAGCRTALDAHCRTFPNGADPAPLRQACDWIEALPAPAEEHGPALLLSCLTLRKGDAPGFSSVGFETGRRASRELARRIMAQWGGNPSLPLTDELPWGIFHLLAGNPRAARPILAAWAKGLSPAAFSGSSVASLALGESLSALGLHGEAWVAYRDGFGLDPAGTRWEVTDPAVDRIRQAAQAEPSFGGDWWVAGACLDGGFPRFGGADRERVGRWSQSFEAGLTAPISAPVLFFLALRLSEQGLAVGVRALARARSTLRDLHVEAYEIHLERLAAP